MSTTAEQYGFGARARYTEPRASEYDMKERARLSGLFPRVNDEPMGKTLSALVKAFEKNAALGAILARRRALEGRSQYVLQSREAMDAVNQSLAPWARTGQAVEAKSARVAQQVAAVPAVVPEVVPDAAAVMTGGKYSVGHSESSTRATDTATVPSEGGKKGQGIPQATLTGQLASVKPTRKSKKSKPFGTSPLTTSLTKWRSRSTG